MQKSTRTSQKVGYFCFFQCLLPDQLKNIFMSKIQVHCHRFVIFLFVAVNKITLIRLIIIIKHLSPFFGEEKISWGLPSKKKLVDENLHFQRHTNFLVKLQRLVLELLFISYFVLRRQTAEFIFSNKKFVK